MVSQYILVADRDVQRTLQKELMRVAFAASHSLQYSTVSSDLTHTQWSSIISISQDAATLWVLPFV